MPIVSTLLLTLLVAPTPGWSSSLASTIAATPAIPIPLGYGRYCSLTYASGGRGFTWGNRNANPCADMLASSPGGTIARAGLYSMAGENNVVARCSGNFVVLKKGSAEAPLQAAFDATEGKSGCVYTVAPRKLPIFHAPFDTSAAVGFGRGIDFAFSFDVVDNGGQLRNQIDYEGNYAPGSDGHGAIDWTMPRGTELRAVADGLVIEARERHIGSSYGTASCPTADSPKQQEIFILHKVGTGAYAELFVSYYAHGREMSVSPGQTVTRGEKVGESGHTGCSHAPHLHFGVTRHSNAADYYRKAVEPVDFGAYWPSTHIDPYGFDWSAKVGFDPMGWRDTANRHGALSIDLWQGTKPVR